MILSCGNDPAARKAPRIRPGLAVVPCEDGVMFVAGAWGRLITGADAQRVLLPVSRMLDGRRTADEIAAATGFERAVIEQLIEALTASGCIEEASQRNTSPSCESHEMIAAYLNKTGHPDRAETIKALSTSCVLVAGPSELAERMARDLRGSGVGTVLGSKHGFRPDHERVSGALTGQVLAVVLDDGSTEASRLIAGLLAGEYGRRIPVLRVFSATKGIEIGPLYDASSPPNATTCHQCVRAGRERLWPSTAPADSVDGLADVGGALAVAETLAVLADIGPRRLRSHQTLVFISWPELAESTYMALPEPGCAVCWGKTADTDFPDRAPDLLTAYEDLVQSDRAFFQRPAIASKMRGHLREDSHPGRMAHLSGPRIPLPSGEALADDLGMIASLLRGTVGPRHPHSDGDYTPWTASGGDLGSVGLYLIAHRPLLGWQPGTIFRYDDLADELVVLRRDPITADTLLGPNVSIADVSPPDLAIVLTTDVGRLRAQFGSFALRLGHLDAGSALAQLNAMASLHGLRMAVSTRWSARLPSDLELQDDGDIITSVAWINGLGGNLAHSR